MADQNTTIQNDELDITDADAEKLLADAVDDTPAAPPSAESATDDKDWKADAEKWRRLSRQNEATAKANAAKLQQYEDQGKSEAERLQQAATSNLTRAEKAEAALRSREIAEARAPEHATVAHIKAVAKRLVGDSDDDLEADADDLFALLAPAPPTPKTPTRPKERLRGGAEPDEDTEESDPRKLAALVPRRR